MYFIRNFPQSSASVEDFRKSRPIFDAVMTKKNLSGLVLIGQICMAVL